MHRHVVCIVRSALVALCSEPIQMSEDPSWVSGIVPTKATAKESNALHKVFTALWSRLKPSHPGTKRQLQQSSQTYQATLTFSVLFLSQSSTTTNPSVIAADLMAALQKAIAPVTATFSITPDTAGASLVLNVSVTFPPGNAVSSVPSQATLSAVNLANALQQNAAQTLSGLVAKDGPVQLTFVSLTDTLVPVGSTPAQQLPPPAAPASLTSAPSAPALLTTSPSNYTPAPVQVPIPTSQAAGEATPALLSVSHLAPEPVPVLALPLTSSSAGQVALRLHLYTVLA